MCYEVKYVNPKNSYDIEVKYLSSFADIEKNCPIGKAINRVKVLPSVPACVCDYEAAMSDLR